MSKETKGRSWFVVGILVLLAGWSVAIAVRNGDWAFVVILVGVVLSHLYRYREDYFRPRGPQTGDSQED